jgi:ankyrin repeat protein
MFLYQVFPQSISFYHRFLIKACHENDLETVRRLVEFFATFDLTFINLREPKSLNSALHIAVLNGYFVILLSAFKTTFYDFLQFRLFLIFKDVLLVLLDNYADPNIKNKDGNTPLMLAADACQRDCFKLLLEYGADVNIKNNRRNTVLTQPLGAEMKAFVQSKSQTHFRIVSSHNSNLFI